MWISVSKLPTLVRQAIYRVLASGELRSHGEIGWAGILWYESYDAGNRVMAKILDETLRFPLLVAAMRAFYLEAKQLITYFRRHDDHKVISAVARKSTQTAIRNVINMVMSRPDIWQNTTDSNSNNVHMLQRALDYMIQKKFSKAGVKSVAREVRETLASQFPSSTLKHLKFLQQ